mmetsp:Transcript_10003/g.25909  ORF Transcript_10003/g.25909 Transcript_10003/m.25909 type:complete len:220 (-) Transcript_10003:419-1078(-)
MVCQPARLQRSASRAQPDPTTPLSRARHAATRHHGRMALSFFFCSGVRVVGYFVSKQMMRSAPQMPSPGTVLESPGATICVTGIASSRSSKVGTLTTVPHSASAKLSSHLKYRSLPSRDHRGSGVITSSTSTSPCSTWTPWSPQPSSVEWNPSSAPGATWITLSTVSSSVTPSSVSLLRVYETALVAPLYTSASETSSTASTGGALDLANGSCIPVSSP